MENALLEMRAPNPPSIAACAVRHGVSRSTLGARLSGRPARSAGHRVEQYLSTDEESVLARHVERLLEGGFSASLSLLRKLATEMQNRSCPDNMRPVGNHWHLRFLKRHSGLSSAWSSSLSSKRAHAGSSGVIYPFLTRLKELCQKYGIAPSDMWNMDEKGFILGSGARTKVLVRAPHREADRQRREAGNRDFVTVVDTVNAEGTWLDPLVIFKAKHLQEDWLGSNRPEGKPPPLKFNILITLQVRISLSLTAATTTPICASNGCDRSSSRDQPRGYPKGEHGGSSSWMAMRVTSHCQCWRRWSRSRSYWPAFLLIPLISPSLWMWAYLAHSKVHTPGESASWLLWEFPI